MLYTGTNNVYPEFCEGTTAGIAASYIACGNMGSRLKRGKRIDVYIDNQFTDIALVDAVVTNIPYTGSRVVTDIENIKEIVVCGCSSDAIGFSSMIGCVKICEDDDEFGYRLKLAKEGTTVLTSVSPGQLVNITYSELVKIDLEEKYLVCPDYDGTIALDGERTFTFRKGSQIEFVINRKAPYKANMKKILYEAVNHKFFHVHAEKGSPICENCSDSLEYAQSINV